MPIVTGYIRTGYARGYVHRDRLFPLREKKKKSVDMASFELLKMHWDAASKALKYPDLFEISDNLYFQFQTLYFKVKPHWSSDSESIYLNSATPLR